MDWHAMEAGNSGALYAQATSHAHTACAQHTDTVLYPYPALSFYLFTHTAVTFLYL